MAEGVRGVKALRCEFPECTGYQQGLGYCGGHRYQLRKADGDKTKLVPLRPYGKGPSSGWLNKQGYRVVSYPDHPNAGYKGKLFEHWVVMSEKLGRPLMPGENVHHINGVRDDNRPENLELWVTSQPRGQRPEDLLEWAYEIIDRYGEN